MENTIDTLKFVADLARNNGVMEGQNAALQEENKKLREKIEKQKADYKKLEEAHAKLQESYHNLLNQWQAMESMPNMVIQPVFILSVHKTVHYLSHLDNNKRAFMGHFFHHTFLDGTPSSVKAKVDEITSLEPNPTKRIAESTEKIAENGLMNVGGDVIAEGGVKNVKNINNEAHD